MFLIAPYDPFTGRKVLKDLNQRRGNGAPGKKLMPTNEIMVDVDDHGEVLSDS